MSREDFEKLMNILISKGNSPDNGNDFNNFLNSFYSSY